MQDWWERGVNLCRFNANLQFCGFFFSKISKISNHFNQISSFVWDRSVFRLQGHCLSTTGLPAYIHRSLSESLSFTSKQNLKPSVCKYGHCNFILYSKDPIFMFVIMCLSSLICLSFLIFTSRSHATGGNVVAMPVCLCVCLCVCVSVCLSVCLSVGAISQERMIWSKHNFVHTCILVKARTA